MACGLVEDAFVLSFTTDLDVTVGNRTLRVGQFVQAGTQLMSVVPTDAAYVVANYKETQLTDVKRGQPATIEVDMFPGRVFHGDNRPHGPGKADRVQGDRGCR